MHFAGKRILVVDDDAAIADFMRDAFSSNGASVRIAASVKDGLAALRAGEFDLILLDYVISEKVAEQFLAKATMLGSGTVPVIIVSGHGENLAMDRFRNFPQVKAVLSKPFEPGVLLELAAKAVT